MAKPAQLASGAARSCFLALFVVLALVTVVFAGAAAPETKSEASVMDGNVAVPMCIMSQLSSATGPLASGREPVASWASLRWTKAAMLAVEHVNNADCSVLGPGCEALLLPAGGGGGDETARVRLSPHFVNLRSLSSAGVVDATQACLETDAQVLLGVANSEQTSLVAAYASDTGAPAIIYIARYPTTLHD